MKNLTFIQNAAWLCFLLYYCASKFLAGFQAYSHAYAIQVAIIVAATAVIPYYLTRYAARRGGAGRAIPTLVLPSVLAMGGYALFFVVFIAPNFPDIAAAQVVVRGLFPGLVISAILLLPDLVAATRRGQTQAE